MPHDRDRDRDRDCDCDNDCALCGACTGMLGERGVGLVVHIPLGYVAQINICDGDGDSDV